MRTTLEFPDLLFHRAKVAAAERRITLRELVTEALERALEVGSPLAPRMVEPPVVLGAGLPVPALTNAEVAALWEEDELMKTGS